MNEPVSGASTDQMDRLTSDQLALLAAVDGASPVEGEAAQLRALGESLRDATRGQIDVADDVLAAIALNDAVTGEIDVADEVLAAIALNDAVRGEIDVADDVLAAVALNQAVRSPVDVADRVMAEVLPKVAAMPKWISLGAPLAAMAAAAALMLAILPDPEPMVITGQLVEAPFTLAAFNQVEVEDISVSPNAAVQVMQFDEGGPTFIFVEEDAQ